MDKSDEYKKSLRELDNIFYLILERYKTEYPLKEAYPTEENRRLYADSKSQLENTYKDLFVLENNIDAATKKISTKSTQYNDNIKNLKSRYDEESAMLKKLKDSDLASYPLQREFEKKRFYNYFAVVYYSIAAVFLIYLIWTGSRIARKQIPVAKPVFSGKNMKFLPIAVTTFVMSPKVAKIATGSAALLAGLIAYNYS